MSLIQHRFLPRSMFDMDLWHSPAEMLGFGPSTLDLFDPFDELDNLIGRNFMWLSKPHFMDFPLVPRVPEKYRITVDCRGYNPKSIKTELTKDNTKLIVSGREGENKNGEEDYSLREFRRTYNIPKNAETHKLVSFLTSNGQLVVEIPLKLDESLSKEEISHFYPRIVDGENGSKHVEMKLSIPENIEPSKIKVTCKDRDLIVQAEDKLEKPDGMSQIYYYRRSTMPENTNFDTLKCLYDKNNLSIKADLNSDFKERQRVIPIQVGSEKTKESIANK